MMQNNESQQVEFWEQRLRLATEPLNAIGVGFDWVKIDDIHKKIFYQHYRPGMKVLDIGCGIGRTATWIPAEDYTGFDFVPGFLEIARKTYPTYRFDLQDIKAGLPYADKEFDIGLGISFKHIFITGAGREFWEEKALPELKRVSKKLMLIPYGNNDSNMIQNDMEIYE